MTREMRLQASDGGRTAGRGRRWRGQADREGLGGEGVTGGSQGLHAGGWWRASLAPARCVPILYKLRPPPRTGGWGPSPCTVSLGRLHQQPHRVPQPPLVPASSVKKPPGTGPCEGAGRKENLLRGRGGGGWRSGGSQEPAARRRGRDCGGHGGVAGRRCREGEAGAVRREAASGGGAVAWGRRRGSDGKYGRETLMPSMADLLLILSI